MCNIETKPKFTGETKMTIAERIKRIANKANVSYSFISNIINSTYGKENNSIDKLKILEKQYGI